MRASKRPYCCANLPSVLMRADVYRHGPYEHAYWLALCVLPPIAVPCAVAYSWIRRGELEYEIRAGAGRDDR